MTSGLGKLSGQQRSLATRWLPGAIVEEDHSWDLVDTVVLRVSHSGSRLIVKAGGDGDHHIEREIHAHRHWLAPWASTSRAPVLRHFDVEAKLLVTSWLPGRLVLGTDHADHADTYRQAGRLLALFHGQTAVPSDDFEARENRKSLAWLSRPHRIPADVEQRLRVEIASWPTPPATLVPTHGDWQPRNWLTHRGVVSVIDFGRAALRPASADFARLAAQDFRRNPALESAFLDGYGPDPREASAWHRHRIREAIGTAAWAHQVGDEDFEAQGHRMISEAFASSPAGPPDDGLDSAPR